MIQLFHIPNHKIDTSNYSHSLHDKRVEELEKKIADYVGAKYACAVNSGTAALHLAIYALNLKSNDEVIVTCLSFVA